jgi:hypothetical protein
MFNYYKAWVDNIDSVYWTDGTWRYRWNIKEDLGTLIGNIANTYMIEGMGYINRFLDDPFLDYRIPHTLTTKICCFKTKNQWLYSQSNPWGADCDTMIVKDIVPVGINSIQNELAQALLYPNPLNSDRIIHFNYYGGERGKDYRLLAYDIYGKEILSQICQPGQDIQINNSLPHGFYLFKIIEQNGQPISQQTIIINQ